MTEEKVLIGISSDLKINDVTHVFEIFKLVMELLLIVFIIFAIIVLLLAKPSLPRGRARRRLSHILSVGRSWHPWWKLTRCLAHLLLVRSSTGFHEYSLQVALNVPLLVIFDGVQATADSLVVIMGRCSDCLHSQLVLRIAQLLVTATFSPILLLLLSFVSGLLYIRLLLMWLGQATFEIASLFAATCRALMLLIKVSEDLIELCLHFLYLDIVVIVLLC